MILFIFLIPEHNFKTSSCHLQLTLVSYSKTEKNNQLSWLSTQNNQILSSLFGKLHLQLELTPWNTKLPFNGFQ